MEELILVTPVHDLCILHLQLTVYDITLVWKNQIAAAFLSKMYSLKMHKI